MASWASTSATPRGPKARKPSRLSSIATWGSSDPNLHRLSPNRCHPGAAHRHSRSPRYLLLDPSWAADYSSGRLAPHPEVERVGGGVCAADAGEAARDA